MSTQREIVRLQEQLSSFAEDQTANRDLQQQLREKERRNLATLQGRVREALGRKDQDIHVLKEEVHAMLMRGWVKRTCPAPLQLGQNVMLKVAPSIEQPRKKITHAVRLGGRPQEVLRSWLFPPKAPRRHMGAWQARPWPRHRPLPIKKH
eukprot:GHVT01048823.1.p1 GENE.GHVT01048823.1~~GHVT01048823.1.p1  ORF type:complete len:150 (+),score=18.09 GHVT01048823.1:1374-1823(+)